MLDGMEKNANMKYFYKIREKTTGKYYVGCQWRKDADHNNFWVTYFTSSKYIKEQPKENFEVLRVEAREDAREYEARYLKKAYGLLGRERFLELMINRHCIDFGVLSDEVKELRNKKLAEFNQGRRWWTNGIETKRTIDCPGEGWYNGRDPEHGKSQSMALIGKPSKIKGMKYSEEAKAARRAMGLKFWNNGVTMMQAAECPGPDWKPGMLFIPRSAEWREKISKGRRRWAEQRRLAQGNK